MNDFEKKIADALTTVHTEVIRGGWPDLLVHNKRDGTICAVECKSKTDSIKPHQKKVIGILNEMGIPTYIARSYNDAIAIKKKKGRKPLLKQCLKEEIENEINTALRELSFLKEQLVNLRESVRQAEVTTIKELCGKDIA